MNLRAIVKVNNKVESIIEADRHTVWTHIKESFEMCDDTDDISVTIRKSIHLDQEEEL